jgi:lipoprotein-anchoring transpeptidase ErfK/SrfK
MKIPSITTNIKRCLGIGALASAVIMASPRKSYTKINETPSEITDTFEKAKYATPMSSQSASNTGSTYNTTTKADTILPPPKGSSDKSILNFAPSPKVKIMGENKIATIVVNLSNNVLYHYDENGNADCAYRIASGKPQTPTHTGVRVVTHVESYPYRSAPPHTKRYKNPQDYGPKIIMLNVLDPKTGERSDIGEFIHGNRNASSLGKYVSHGCMRMDNEVIKKLSASAKRGDIVLITK